MRELALLLTMFTLVNSQPESLCAFDLRDIKAQINESLNGAVTDYVLNCLVRHDGLFAESISLSAFTSMDEGLRYDFQCYQGSTLIPTVSMNVSSVYHHACSFCNFSLSDPCEDAGKQSDDRRKYLICECVSS